MGQFDSAVNAVLKNEGGLEENVADPGGITRYGISLRFIREIPLDRLKRYGIFEPITDLTIREMTIDQARLIYRGEFWEAAPFEKIQNQMLCNYIFDMCVNMGIAQATKLVQRSVWACQKKKDFIKDDGVMGSITVGAINQCSFMLMVAMAAHRDGFYRMLVALDPAKKEFLDGWLSRCYRD